MRYIKDGPYQHAICDFCERDKSHGDVHSISPLGEKGICDLCVDQLRDLLGVGALDGDLMNIGKKVGYF